MRLLGDRGLLLGLAETNLVGVRLPLERDSENES